MTHLLGIQIANGFSPEARVFAGLLRNSSPGLRAHILHQAWDGDQKSIQQFATTVQDGRVESSPDRIFVEPRDFGWRSLRPDRSHLDKIRERIRFVASLPRSLVAARKANPDIVYSCQQQWDCLAATYIARRLKKPQIIHLHYVIGPWLHKPVLQRLLTCHHVIAVSDFIRDEALEYGVAPDRVTTVRNTISVPSQLPDAQKQAKIRRDLGIAANAPVAGIVARLDPDKGQEDTIRAFAQASVTVPDSVLLIVGDETPWHPGYGDRLKQLAAKLNLADRVHFLGRRNDVPELLSIMQVFAHPSRREPFGLAMAEASAMSVPVVAFADGGVREIVQDGVTGMLALPGDIDALAHCLSTLLSCPARSRELGEAGRQRMISDFHPSVAGTAFMQVLQKIGIGVP